MEGIDERWLVMVVRDVTEGKGKGENGLMEGEHLGRGGKRGGVG